MSPLITLCRQLIQQSSITPQDAGCQSLIKKRLQPLGFRCTDYSQGDTTNTLLSHGHGSPHIVFAGHTDVVPPGDLADWLHPPFLGHIDNNQLFGRGATDMKGAVAAMVITLEQLVKNNPNHSGTVSLLLTSDEEGPGTQGMTYVVEQLKKNRTYFDFCLVGEPTSDKQLGDTIKVGRRGSLHGQLKLQGKQGHIAYPNAAKNPIHSCLPVLQALIDTPLNKGDDYWPETTLQISNIQSGTGALNVTPHVVWVDFNIRYSPCESLASIQEKVQQQLEAHSHPHSLAWSVGALPYHNQAPTLVATIKELLEPRLKNPLLVSMSGGTSDARFLCHISQEVIEYGLLNKSAHQVNEHIDLDDLTNLQTDYSALLSALLIDAESRESYKMDWAT